MIEEEEARVRESGGNECDMLLKNNIEGIIIKWAYQVNHKKYIKCVHISLLYSKIVYHYNL